MTPVRPEAEEKIRYMVTEEMFDALFPPGHRGQSPTYRVDEVAKLFFGMSASWLRLNLRADDDYPETHFTYADGTRMNFRRLDPGKTDSAREFILPDIAPMALSLFRFGSIDGIRLGRILRIVEAEAVLYGLIEPPDGSGGDEG